MWETHSRRRNSTFIQYDTSVCARESRVKNPDNGSRKTVVPRYFPFFVFCRSRRYKWSIALGDRKMRLLDQFCTRRERRYLARGYTSRERRRVFMRKFGDYWYTMNEKQKFVRSKECSGNSTRLGIRKWNIWYWNRICIYEEVKSVEVNIKYLSFFYHFRHLPSIRQRENKELNN